MIALRLVNEQLRGLAVFFELLLLQLIDFL